VSKKEYLQTPKTITFNFHNKLESITSINILLYQNKKLLNSAKIKNKMHKQVILVRQDLKLPKGKLAAQCSHASVDTVIKSDRKMVELWKKEGGKKVVLKVADEKELFKYMSMLENEGIKVALIRDAGHTVVEPGTVTCLGVGPDNEEKIDKITGKLKMV